MRGFLWIILNFILLTGVTQEHANFIVQSDDSTKFLLEIDNKLQLDSAHYNIKVTGMEDQSHDVRLILVNNDSQVVEKALFFQNMGVESTMKLVNLNGEYKLRYFGEVSMGAAPLLKDQVIVDCSPNAGEFVTPQTDVSQMSKVEAYSYELQNNSTLTFTESNGSTSQESVMSEQSPASEPVLNDSIILDSLSPLLDSNKVYNPDILETVYNYEGEKGCSFPDFEPEILVNSIQDTPFSSQKIKLAKKGIQGKCITTKQVELIANMLEFEDDKLEFIKHAYQYTYDKNSYRTLLKLFNFENTKSDFLEFINV